MKYIVCTYDIVTEESAQNGDTAEHGFESCLGHRHPIQDTDGYHKENVGLKPEDIGYEVTLDEYDFEEGMTIVDKAVDYLEGNSAFYPSNAPTWSNGTWYNALSTMSYDNGESTGYAYHLHGFTQEEEQEIYTRITKR